MKLIQKIMEDYEITQERIAASSGVAQYRLSLISNGKVQPSKTERAKLERYFETQTEILLGDIKNG